MLGEQRHKSVMDNEITITIRPRHIFRASLYVVLILGVFMLGRLSVEAPSFNLTGMTFGESNEANDSDDEAEEKEVVVPEPEAVPAAEAPAPAAAAAPAEVPAPAVDTPAPVAITEAPADLVTSYSKVSLALSDVTVDWKETWGKITNLNVVILNNEEGTIQAKRLGMIVEGYLDFEKKVPISSSIQYIASKTKLEAKVPVPNGFSYAESSTGDLASVEITLTLYDGTDKKITTVTKAVSLKK